MIPIVPTIRVIALLCQAAGPQFGVVGPKIEFCAERVMAEKVMTGDVDRERAQCNIEAQWQIAANLPEGMRVKSFRCATNEDSNFRPAGSI